MTAFVNGDGPLETCRAHELDRLVDRGVPRDAVEVGELVGADAQRSANRRVELRAPAAAPSASMPWSSARDALHRAVGDLLGERAVAGVEALGGGGQRAIGVRVLLEDAPDDLVRGAPCRRDGHRLRLRGVGHWEPYARAPESTVVGELLVHRGLRRELFALMPASYGSGAGRYPVLYAHDGQNLFDEATSHSGEWRVDETMADLAGEGIEAIVVGIANDSDARASDYSPWPQEPLRRARAGGRVPRLRARRGQAARRPLLPHAARPGGDGDARLVAGRAREPVRVLLEGRKRRLRRER